MQHVYADHMPYQRVGAEGTRLVRRLLDPAAQSGQRSRQGLGEQLQWRVARQSEILQHAIEGGPAVQRDQQVAFGARHGTARADRLAALCHPRHQFHIGIEQHTGQATAEHVVGHVQRPAARRRHAAEQIAGGSACAQFAQQVTEIGRAAVGMHLRGMGGEPDVGPGSGRRPEKSRNDWLGKGASISTGAGSSMYSTPFAHTPTPSAPTQATPGQSSLQFGGIASAASA